MSSLGGLHWTEIVMSSLGGLRWTEIVMSSLGGLRWTEIVMSSLGGLHVKHTVSASWNLGNNSALHNLHISPTIVRTIKSRRMRLGAASIKYSAF
jgi:hypothetical protein